MLKDLAVELAVLFCLFFSFFLFVPNAKVSFNSIMVPLLFFGFLGFLGLALFQLKRLLDRDKKKHAVIFIVILIATVIGAFVLAWMLSEPIPID